MSDTRRAELDRLAGMPEEQQDRYLVEQVPASQREQFIQDLQSVAAEDGGIWGEVLDNVIGSLTAGGRADRLSERAIREASSAETEYVQVSGSPNANYRAIPHEELQRWSTTDNDPGRVGESAADYETLKTGYEGMNESVAAAVGGLRGAWEGDAGEAAMSYGDQLAKHTESSASNARLASEVTTAQADSSSGFRNAMPEPVPFSWESEMASARSAGPFEAISIVGNAYEKQAKSQAAHDQAAQVAQQFEQSTHAAAGKTPVFTEPPKFAGTGGGESVGSGSGGSVGGVGGSAPSFGGSAGGGTSASGARGGGSAGGSSPGGGGTAPSAGSPGSGGSGGGSGLPPGAVRLPDGSVRMPDGTVIKPDGTKVLPDGTKVLPDGTRILPDGRVIPPGNTTSSGLASGSGSDAALAAGLAPLGSAGGTAGGVGAGGPGGGAAGGFGPLGSGAGSGAGAGGGLGAGKGSGVGGFGPPGSGAAAAKGGFGGMGRGGMGGMMGGAGAGRGQGGDGDDEHTDRYYVRQEMDPGMKVEYDEHGEKLIDETTGMTVVPPVIGE
ncbi:MAG: hypothetical protein ACRDQB_00360 [Thermocrispum sp.]